MSTIIERIKEFCFQMRMSENKLANEIGVNPQTLNNYTSGKRKVGFEVVDKILNRFPQISAEWLLRGVGSMCCQPTSDIDTLYNTQGDNSNNVQVVGKADDAVLALKDEKIQMLEDQVKFLKEQVEFYKSQKDA